MKWRFRKSVRIAPGVRINLSGSGVSTTLGRRGASLNLGARGARATVGIPGTGISGTFRSSGAGPPRDPDAGAAPGGGAAGAGCLGLLLLVLIAMCAAPDEPSSSRAPVSSTGYSTPAVTQPGYGSPASTEPREWFYIHGTLNVRAAPKRSAAIVRTLRRGDLVQLGAKDANGWAPLYSGGAAEGYVYRASDLVRTRAPAAEGPADHASGGGTRSRRSSAADRGYYTGPRGGCYTYSASGRKRYVDRSYCN